MSVFYNRIPAVFLSTAVLTLESGPDGIKLIHSGFHHVRLIGEYTGLEVACAGTLHTYAGTGKIGAADVRQLAVEDNYLEMHAGTQGTLKAREEDRIVVKVLTEVGAGLLGVNEAHFPTLLDKIGQHAQEGTVFHVQILDVSRAYPKGALHLRHFLNNFLEVGFVCDVLRHMLRI